MRIWDIHYHGLSEGDLRRHEETMFYVERMGIERVLSLDIAGSQADPLGRSVSAEEPRRRSGSSSKTHANRVSGLIPIDPGQPCGELPEDGGVDPRRPVRGNQSTTAATRRT